MPNGKYILNDLEFERQIKVMGDRELLEYTARLSYSTAIRYHNLENKMNGRIMTKKTTGVMAGIGAVIGAGIASAIDYFIKRGG